MSASNASDYPHIRAHIAARRRPIIHNEIVYFSKSAGERFKWSFLFGWGIGIYAVMFLVWRLFVLYGFIDGLGSRLSLLVILIVLALCAGRSLKYNFVSDILPYAIGWTLIAIALDALTVLPFAGSALYADWNLWVGYGLVLTVPLLAPSTRSTPAMPEIT